MEVKKDENLHTSVLLQELIDGVAVKEDRKNVIVDCTLGLAGHASEIIKMMNPGDIFVGFDADERNLKLAKQKLKQTQTKTQSSPEIILIHSNFLYLKRELQNHGIDSITGIYYDL